MAFSTNVIVLHLEASYLAMLMLWCCFLIRQNGYIFWIVTEFKNSNKIGQKNNKKSSIKTDHS